MTVQTVPAHLDRWQAALIRTKMLPPRPPRGRVGRRRLVERLDNADARCAAVVAPAGFGKTTLLAEWYETVRARGALAAWLSLDDDDDDPQQLGAYLVAALTLGAGGHAVRAADLLREDPLTPMKTVQAVLLNEIADCGRPVYLFLDDFERLHARPSLALVARLLRYAPPNLRVVIGSRHEPALTLAPVGVPPPVGALGAADLRFTADDAQAFFAQADGVSLDRVGVELLNDATEGWVTGLQLAGLALRERSGDAARLARDLAGQRFGIDAYLEGAVFARLPSAMQQFVLRVSVLDRLSAGACDAVIGAGARSGEKLDWLERHNVFLRALDPDRRWFRFHALMSEALRRRAEQQLGAELPALHRRAGQWFAAEALWPEAVRHALAGGEPEQAARWAERGASALIDRSDVRALQAWFAKLPAPLVAGSLRLRLAKAWAETLSFRIREAKRSVEAIAALLDTPADATPAADDDPTLPAEVASLRALIAGFADDIPASLACGAEADRLPGAPRWALRFAQAARIFGLAYSGRSDELRQLRPTLQAPDAHAEPLYASVFRFSMLGLASLVEGRLHEAAGTFEHALAHAEAMAGRESAAAALPAGYLATLYYERNDLVRARRVLEGRAAIAMAACPLGSLLRHACGAARLYAREGDVASALVVLDEARELADERDWLRLRAGCDAEAVRLLIRAGRLADADRTAQDWLATLPAQLPSPAGSFVETWAAGCEIRARLALAHGRPQDAVAVLQPLCAQLGGLGLRYLQARAAIVLALALERSRPGDAAGHALEDALRFAEAEPIVGSFVDEGDAMFNLLRRARPAAVRPRAAGEGTVDRLLEAFAAVMAPPRAAPATAPGAPVPVLSARELEILHLIAHGLSNKEIARALRVAPETIKWHLKKIFEKLNVGSRIEAVQSALGFLRDPAPRP